MAISRQSPDPTSSHSAHPTVPRKQGRGGGLRRAVSAQALLMKALLAMAFVAAALASAGAEIIKKEDMLRGITTTREQCAATRQTLWLNVDNQDFCVRYYLSTAGGEGRRPVIFLDGDRLGAVNTITWQWIPISEDRNYD